MEFDPDGAAQGEGLYGLPDDPEGARVVVIPVPFDATTSYRDGTRNGPAAVLAASHQVDLFDLDFGRPYLQGITMRPLGEGPAATIRELGERARELAVPVIEAGGVLDGRPELEANLAEVNRIGSRLNELVEAQVESVLAAGRIAWVLGGDHSTPFGSIRAHGRRFPGLGILHVDAHADLRDAYEGFEWSHASIMHNVVTRIGAEGGVASLVQVGIRDFGEAEYAMTQAGDMGTRIVTHFDQRLAETRMRGGSWASLAERIVADLPEHVYLSLDIDGLDPKLCPDTGTPVPGGLAIDELWELLRAVVRSGRRIVGGDLNEVAPCRSLDPGEWGKDWNANVGARVLYRSIGAALAEAGPGR